MSHETKWRAAANIAQNDIVGRDAVGRDEEQMIRRGRLIDVADLSTRKQLEIGKVRVRERTGRRLRRVHGG